MGRPPRIFVSTRFHADAEGQFLTTLLGSLTRQDLDPVVNRGVRGRIRTGEVIAERNRADIAESDLFLALVSPTYHISPYCRIEADAALRERSYRGLPTLVAAWPGMPSSPDAWTEPCRALARAGEGFAKVFAIDPREGLEHADQLCEDVCHALGVPFRADVDPVGPDNPMPFIRRTRRAVAAFPPEDRGRLDGDLTQLLDDLARHHDDAAAERDLGYATLQRGLGRIVDRAAPRFTPGAMAYLRLGEAVYALLAAGEASGQAHETLVARAHDVAHAALSEGDPLTQRDALILLSNLALYSGDAQRGLDWNDRATRVADLLNLGQLGPSEPWATVRQRLDDIEPSRIASPTAPGAYILFSGRMRNLLRLVRLPDLAELRQRHRDWQLGMTYAHPSHHERYAGLLAFGFALCGDLDTADDILSQLQNGEDGATHIHLGAWQELLSALCDGLATGDQAIDESLVDGLDWVSARTETFEDTAPTAAALTHREVAFALKMLARPAARVRALTRALAANPACIGLLIERAEANLLAGRMCDARRDCLCALARAATDTTTFAPLPSALQPGENFYAQGVAHWLLGEEEAARRDHLNSGATRFYDLALPASWRGALAEAPGARAPS